jgi:signal peptidase I
LRKRHRASVGIFFEFTAVLSTSVAFLVFGVSALVLVLISAGLLRLGARWARIPEITYKRAVAAVLLIDVAVLVVHWLVSVAEGHLPNFQGYPIAIPLIELVLGVFAAWAVVQWILRTTLGKAILAWLPTLAATVAAWVLVLAVVRPYVFEAFIVPTNAMAPTILGRHLRSVCPACGGVGYISAAGRDAYAPTEELGICGNCLHASRMAATSNRVFEGDRILAAKFLQPQRWDLIVFRYPEDPSINYVERLVGLPGEEIAIEDGDVWVNGARVQKPNRISGIVYAADPLSVTKAVWGPVKLGTDEYFVLGDFSLRSKDSRLWESGAPGHSPYAVPESYIVGVVTHTYWPPARWRIFR